MNLESQTPGDIGALSGVHTAQRADLPFAGRRVELVQLRERFAQARSGAGGVVVISGDAGIGKTSLARAAAAEAKRTGATVLSGRAYEGGWSPPLRPWIEVLEGLAGIPGARLESVLLDQDPTGRAAAAVAELVPVLGLPLRDLPVPAPLSPEEERFRLHDGIARLLRTVSSDQPMVILFDDLHWADRGSLFLLRHVLHVTTAAPLLAIGTYRDGEVTADHPLAELLPMLRRETDFTAMQLGGLATSEIAELIGNADAAELAAAIHGETGGNPFFVAEVVRSWQSGETTSDTVPEGVRQLVSRRIARLSPNAQRLLTHTSVFNAGFDFAVLPYLTELSEDDLLEVIDELLAARLIESVGGRAERYDFVHAIVRRTIAETTNPSRRVRLERAAAEALDRTYAGRAEPHAAEIAALYHRSASLPGTEAGVPHALAAAEAARRGFDRSQVVEFLRIAQELGAPDGSAERARVLTSLAVAEADAVLIDAARATAVEALSALREAHATDDEIAAFFADLVMSLKQNASADSRIWRPLLEQGLSYAESERGPNWARLMLLVDVIEPVSRERIRAGRWLGFDPEAIAIARESPDEIAAARAIESFDYRTRAETEAYLETARTWQQPAAVMYGMTVAANDLQYRHGAFRDAEMIWQELAALAEGNGAVNWQAQATNQLTGVQIAFGRFAEARDSETRANTLMDRLGSGRRSHVLAMEMATAFALEEGGDWTALAAFWSEIVDDPALGPYDPGTLVGPLYAAFAAYCLEEAEERAAAAAMLELLTPILLQYTSLDANHNGTVALAGAAVWRLGLAELAPAYHRFAVDLEEQGLGDYPQTSLALTVARMETLMGRRVDAERAFARARDTLDASGQRPVRAVVDLDEATSLIEAGDAANYARVTAMLDAADAAFAQLGMTPWVNRAHAARSAADQRLGGRVHLPGGLSEREADVVRLVARGYSDRQISDELYISPRTVNAHLRNMLNKTGSSNRTELSVWAVEHGLVAPATS